jgi:ABC-2 type transport system permease protein
MLDYPYFIDLRPPGLAPDHAVTANLPQVTMAWASPVTVKPDGDRQTTVLLKSSSDSWLSHSMDIMPRLDDNGVSNFQPPTGAGDRADSPALTASRDLGVVVQGRFKSFFANRDIPLTAQQPNEGATPRPIPAMTALLQRSPESARIVLYGSNDFMSDQVLSSIVTASGTQYLGPLELFTNTLDWALQDEQLLQIRSHAHFNRTLPPMELRAQLLLEYFNYGLALLWLLLLALTSWLQIILRRRHFNRGLSL